MVGICSNDKLLESKLKDIITFERIIVTLVLLTILWLLKLGNRFCNYQNMLGLSTTEYSRKVLLFWERNRNQRFKKKY